MERIAFKMKIKADRVEDYKEAHKLKLKNKVFMSPYKATCMGTPGVADTQAFMFREYKNEGVYLLGEKHRPKSPGYYHCFGLPIRVVAVLLKEAKHLYCINNGIANLAWAVGQRNIYEYLPEATRWK